MKVGVVRGGQGGKAGVGGQLGGCQESLPILERLSLVILTVSTFLCPAYHLSLFSVNLGYVPS